VAVDLSRAITSIQLPEGTSLAKDARTAFAAAGRVFVSYLTAAFVTRPSSPAL
jgi:hypothetical protein